MSSSYIYIYIYYYILCLPIIFSVCATQLKLTLPHGWAMLLHYTTIHTFILIIVDFYGWVLAMALVTGKVWL